APLCPFHRKREMLRHPGLPGRLRLAGCGSTLWSVQKHTHRQIDLVHLDRKTVCQPRCGCTEPQQRRRECPRTDLLPDRCQARRVRQRWHLLAADGARHPEQARERRPRFRNGLRAYAHHLKGAARLPGEVLEVESQDLEEAVPAKLVSLELI